MAQRQAKWWFGFIVLGVMVALAAIPASAQDTGLYGPAGSAGEAYVRVVNAGSLSELPVVRVGTHRFEAVTSVTPYRTVRPGVYIISAAGTAGASSDIILAEGQFATVVVADDGVLTFQDERHTDPARAQIVFYNISSDRPVSLMTADGLIAVAAGVRRGNSEAAVVNAIEIEFAVVTEDEILARVPLLRLRRGQSYAILVVSDEDGHRVVTQQAEMAAQ